MSSGLSRKVQRPWHPETIVTAGCFLSAQRHRGLIAGRCTFVRTPHTESTLAGQFLVLQDIMRCPGIIQAGQGRQVSSFRVLVEQPVGKRGLAVVGEFIGDGGTWGQVPFTNQVRMLEPAAQFGREAVRYIYIRFGEYRYQVIFTVPGNRVPSYRI